MTRTAFEHSLERIQEQMLDLAGMVETAIELGTQALKDRDLPLAHRVIEDDARVNRLRYEIEETCLELIATQQPLASDLRTIVAVLHIVVDLERMGDHAEGIARVAVMLADEPPLMSYADILKMAEAAKRMLLGALQAYKERDAAHARRICDLDDEVDALYEKVYHEIITRMVSAPETIERGTHLTWVAHNLERIADRVTNICERVVYLVEGKLEELNVSKY